MAALSKILSSFLVVGCLVCMPSAGLGAEGSSSAGGDKSGPLAWAHIGEVKANSATDLGVACFVSPAKLSDDVIAQFLAKPGEMLSAFPVGGLRLSDQVRSLVGSSSSTLQPIIELVSGANQSQGAAIGAGLARAVGACQADHLDYATQIQDAVANINDVSFLTAFTGALGKEHGNEHIGAIGAGASPAGSNGGAIPLGQVGQFGAANGFTEGGNQFVLTEVETFSVGSAGNFSTTSVSPF